MCAFALPKNFGIRENILSHIEECFILGNGPTLNKFKLERLEDFFVIGCNRILYSNFEPNIITISDPAVAGDNNYRILLAKTKSKLVFSQAMANRIIKEFSFPSQKINKTVKIRIDKEYIFSYQYNSLWHGNFDETDCMHSVLGDLSIPLAIYLGIKKIYLLGVDEYWNIFDTKIKHFYDHDIGQGAFDWAARGRLRNIWYGKLDLLARQKGTIIMNLSPGSAINSFEKKDAHCIFPNIIDYEKSINGKYIKIKDSIYKIVKSNNGYNNTYSFLNIKNNKYIRHIQGKVVETDENINGKYFKDDSSFYIENSFISRDKICLRCFNIQNSYIVKDIYFDEYFIAPFNSDFIASDSSFEVLNSDFSQSKTEEVQSENKDYTVDIYNNINQTGGKVMPLISEKYKKMYTILHNDNLNYGNSHHLSPEISLLISFLRPKTILDYGCGKGLLTKTLQSKYPNIEFFNYDPCVEKYSKLTRSSFDMILNTDVLEHIPEENIDNILKHIKSLSDNVFFNLHHEKALTFLPNGENAHCTIKPPKWYHEKIKNIFGICIPLISRDIPNTSAVTFKINSDQLFDYSYLIIQSKNSEITKLRNKIKK